MNRIIIISLFLVYGCFDNGDGANNKVPKSDAAASETRVAISSSSEISAPRAADTDIEKMIMDMPQYVYGDGNCHQAFAEQVVSTIMKVADGERCRKLIVQYYETLEHLEIDYAKIGNFRMTLDRYYLLIDFCRVFSMPAEDNERFYELSSVAISKGREVLSKCEDDLQGSLTARQRAKVKNRKGEIETSLFIFISMVKRDYLDWGVERGYINSERREYWSRRFENETAGLKCEWTP